MKQHENIKYQRSSINPSTSLRMTLSGIERVKNVFKNSKLLKSLFVFFIFILLIINLISSQIISPIYFQMINNNKKAVVSFLEKIKTFPEFQKILEMNKNIYGKTVEKEVFLQENEKKLMINNLEQMLTKNPKARDVLYSLYLLYKEKGDNLTAEKYLKQVKEIDPSIKY